METRGFPESRARALLCASASLGRLAHGAEHQPVPGLPSDWRAQRGSDVFSGAAQHVVEFPGVLVRKTDSWGRTLKVTRWQVPVGAPEVASSTTPWGGRAANAGSPVTPPRKAFLAWGCVSGHERMSCALSVHRMIVSVIILTANYNNNVLGT